MSAAPRGKGHRIDGIPEQRLAHADRLRYSTSAAPTDGRYVAFPSRERPDYTTPDAEGGTAASPRSPLRVALVVAAVLITLTAVLGALLGVNDPETTPAGTTSLFGASSSTEAPEARLSGNEPSAPTDETGRLPIDAVESRPSRSTQTGTVVVPERGPGDFRVAAAPNQPLPHGAFTYTVEVEQNLTFPRRSIARLVDETLTDPRSWSTDTRPLVRVDTEPAIRVLLATPETADALCAPLQTEGRLSCRNGANVVINTWRWVNGTPGYTKLRDYRRYVINHEVGHALGNSHESCPSPGRLAPVMLQQSLGLDGCRPNPWPEPSA